MLQFSGTVVEGIQLLMEPNATYYVSPGSVINIPVAAKTDQEWMNQMTFNWFWFKPVEQGDTVTFGELTCLK